MDVEARKRSPQFFREIVEPLGTSPLRTRKLPTSFWSRRPISKRRTEVRACRCQGRTQNHDENMKIVCPCIPFHRDDSDDMKRCWCGLFVDKDVTHPRARRKSPTKISERPRMLVEVAKAGEIAPGGSNGSELASEKSWCATAMGTTTPDRRCGHEWPLERARWTDDPDVPHASCAIRCHHRPGAERSDPDHIEEPLRADGEYVRTSASLTQQVSVRDIKTFLVTIEKESIQVQLD